MSFLFKWPMTLGLFAVGGMFQTARISGRPRSGDDGGETMTKFPLRNLFGWPGFRVIVSPVWSLRRSTPSLEALPLCRRSGVRCRRVGWYPARFLWFRWETVVDLFRGSSCQDSREYHLGSEPDHLPVVPWGNNTIIPRGFARKVNLGYLLCGVSHILWIWGIPWGWHIPINITDVITEIRIL